MGENITEPLAKTRTRRSNAGARMHEMMFAAEDDELLAQAYGLVKAEDDSSDDEEYVPKDLEAGEGEGDDIDFDDDDNDDSNDSGDSSDDSEDEDDEDEEEDGEEDSEDDDIGERIRRLKNGDSKQDVKDGAVIKRENGRIDSRPRPGSPSKSAYDACARICCVCLGEQSDEDDEIIECDSCGITVHESCYGVAGEESHEQDNASVHSNISSESTEPWFCEPCRRSVKNPHCELCPNTGGIFKETDTGRWVHMVCALYTRGVTFENIDNLTEVSLFELNYALYGSKVRLITTVNNLYDEFRLKYSTFLSISYLGLYNM